MNKVLEKNCYTFLIFSTLMTFVGVVPANPTIYDLTDGGGSDSHTIGNAIFSTFDPDGSQGTGIFEPFVRVQASNGEKGYNTDGDVQYATKSGTWTHSITLSEIPVISNGTEEYLQFLLDTNQYKGGLLSIDQIVISLEDSPALTNYPENDFTNFGGPVLYSLDSSSTDNTIITNPDLFGPGSGSGDIEMLIPTSFIPDTDNQWLYLYTELGYDPDALSNDGFEEWGVLVAETAPPTVPAPASVALGMIGMGLVRTLRKRKSI